MSIGCIVSFFNLAISSVIYYQGKKIFSLRSLETVAEEIEFFEEFWEYIKRPRKLARGLFLTCLPCYKWGGIGGEKREKNVKKREKT